MRTLVFDLSTRHGPFKPLNATNGGPTHKRHIATQYRSNLADYRDARIPYTRNHDTNLVSSYGGPYVVDISAIFPDFQADVQDPASYFFENTDESILVPLEAGTRTFYRLGQSIEHQVCKRNVAPPKDYQKWAQICEHIIAHYTEGWANGYRLDMPYWEIWNEPDLKEDSLPAREKPTWGGTKEQFFLFYEVAATYLKRRFPHLKIGGPALAHRMDWAEDFLAYMSARNVPLDFFSWHAYRHEAGDFALLGRQYRNLLDRYGYTHTESHLNEWNYVKNWTDQFVYSLETIHGCKGAAFTMAAISAAQNAPVDMMMYYDTRPSGFNGVFDFYTCRPLKTYYAMKWFGTFYDMDDFVPCQSQVPDIFPLCGISKKGKVQLVLTYYTDREHQSEITFALDIGRSAAWEVYLVDEQHNGELVGSTRVNKFTLQPNTFILLKEI